MKIVAKALIRDKAGDLLLLRRGLTHPNFPEHVDFPGGEVEPDESHIEAVRREIREETGLDVPLENIRQVHLRQLSYDLTHVIFLVNISDNKPEVELSWEHSGFEWIPFDQFGALTLPEGVDNYHLTVLDYLKIARER
jgi:8-oxo-dGTP pyrophosphatase MutT (NUDIX family)